MKKYPKKKAFLYFNDLSNEKIELLESRLPQRTENFIIHTEAMDGNSLLNSISSQFEVYENMRRQTELAQEKQAIAEDIDNNRTEM